MLWILPINLPVLVVWIHNLAVHWLTPFSSHHNILSILPYILLVETMSTGHMVPRLSGVLTVVTNVFLFGLAIYAAVYGVTYAYLLHQLVNCLAAWLMVVHVAGSRIGSYSTTNVNERGVGGGGSGARIENGNGNGSVGLANLRFWTGWGSTSHHVKKRP